MRRWGQIVLLFLLILPIKLIYGQKIEIGDAHQADSINKTQHYYKTKFTPFVAPAYAPETKFMVVAGGLYSFKLDPYDTTIQSSSLPFSVGYSTNKSFLLNVRPSIIFPGDRYRIGGDIWIKDMPYNYWGVGYDKNIAIEESDETTAYWRYWTKIDLKFNRSIIDNLYAGILLDFNYTNATQINSRMLQDEHVLRDGTAIQNSGLGINLEFDSRDVVVNAYRGLFLNLSWTNYGELLGGDFDYNIYVIDYRQYKTILRTGSTLAWQVKGRFGSGEIPWPEMSQLGTPFDLRGYTWGHFRDREMIFGLLEYRYKFLRKNADEDGNMLSKHGFVTWLGTGSIAHSLAEMDNWLPNGGVGYRFEIQPRMNARIDFGFGREAFGVYVSFTEAF